MSGAQAGRLAAYLERVGLAEAPPADAVGLQGLQHAHRMAIPFENVDVRLGREIRIDSEGVFDKLVVRRRGGYCFEQNRLFADVLAELGLPSRPLLARARLGPQSAEHPPRTHVLLLVEFGGEPWIADVGFGGSYLPPLPLADGLSLVTPDGAQHRLRRIGERGALAGEWLLERAGPFVSTDRRGLPHADWQPQYSFDLGEVALADLAQANHWTSTASVSRFTNLQIATIALPRGFASLIDHSLSIADGMALERTEIADAKSYHQVLAERFRLQFDETEVGELPLFHAPS